MAKTSVAIVGGRGYLGQALYAFCADRGIDSWVVGRQSKCEDSHVPAQAYRSAKPDLEQAIAGASVVFHLASVTTPAIGERNPTLEMENITFTMALAQACVNAKVPHLVFASSGGTLYGEITEPVSEDAPANPLCAYGIGKLASERFLMNCSKNTNLNVTILRMSNVHGGHQVKKGDQGVVSYLASQIAADQDVVLLGDTVRDYVYIDDVLESFRLAMERPGKYEIYNISTGIGTSLVALTKLMYHLLRKREKITLSQRRPFDVPFSVLNNQKAKTRLGWTPRNRLEDCLPVYLKARGYL